MLILQAINKQIDEWINLIQLKNELKKKEIDEVHRNIFRFIGIPHVSGNLSLSFLFFFYHFAELFVTLNLSFYKISDRRCVRGQYMHFQEYPSINFSFFVNSI